MMQVAAFEKLIDNVPDDGAPESELGLVSLRINTLKLVEVLGHKLVERRRTGMARLIERGRIRRTKGSHGVVDCMDRACA